jgi:hypothetical protein
MYEINAAVAFIIIFTIMLLIYGFIRFSKYKNQQEEPKEVSVENPVQIVVEEDPTSPH